MKILTFVVLLYVIDIIQGQTAVEDAIKAIGNKQSKIYNHSPPANLVGILNANDDCLKTILVNGTM